ncbi:MAG: hydroxyacid dehydrogenase [Acidobacteria bacterium]|nr:hydroxyacid dehydrogenase [Acidobacteriota bacterium]
MIVLVADPFEQRGLDGLRDAGCDVRYDPALEDQALADALATTGADVLVVRSTAVTEPMLDAGRLSLVVRAGAGYNTIDVAAASRRGIYVSNCPGRNAVAVAELTIGLLLAIDRRIPDNVADLRAGVWNKKRYAEAQGLAGRTLGLLGVGNIGREVAVRAAAFGLPLVLWSRSLAGLDGSLSPDLLDRLGLTEASRLVPISGAPTPTDVARRCHILSVHLALTAETRGLVTGEIFGALPPDAIFLNTSRAELVDPAALVDAVRSRGLRAGLDVFAEEPAGGSGTFADPIVQAAGVYGTHHIGASTAQAQEAIAAETVRIVNAFRTSGRVPNVVNVARRSPATHMLVVRHRDRPGVLAHVFDRLRARGINVQETENIVFAGAEAAVARINLDGQPDDALLDELRDGNADVLDLGVVTLGA